MSARNSALVVGVCFVVVLTVAVAARVMFISYGGGASVVLPDPQAQRRSASPARHPRSATRSYNSVALGTAQQHVDQLQAKLETATAALQEKTKALAATKKECRALEDKLNESVAFAVQILAEGASDQATSDDQDAKSSSDRNLTALKQELRRIQELRDQHLKDLDKLRAELERDEEQIAAMRVRSERDIAELIEEKVTFEIAAGNAILETGEAAIMPLITLLQHERPEVRIWAAAVLAELGPDARSALEPLTMLLQDDDQRVVAQARRAIAAIEP